MAVIRNVTQSRVSLNTVKPCSQSDGTANVAFRKLIGRPLRRLR